jgi:hypothetical protein
VEADGRRDFSLHPEFQRGRQTYHFSNLKPQGKAKSVGASTVQCSYKGGIQFSKSMDKGKQPMLEKAGPLGFVRCPICSKGDLARLVCRQWSFCKNCRKSGHVVKVAGEGRGLNR